MKEGLWGGRGDLQKMTASMLIRKLCKSVADLAVTL
jgi:hypothetical protein